MTMQKRLRPSSYGGECFATKSDADIGAAYGRWVRMTELIREQARACDELGSPMYGELLRLVAEDNELGGQSVPVLRGHEDDPGPSALALRLLGSVHRLVLSGAVPELAAFYPSVGGEWDPVLGWDAFQQVLESHREEIRVWLERHPQTNEVGRAAALMGGLLRLPAALRLPVRLFEFGASAGLNLRADHFHYSGTDGATFGPEDSPVRLDRAWLGVPLTPWPELQIVERAGADIEPLDPTTPDGGLTLMSYVWPDMADRLARLRGALEIAREVPAPVRRQDAAAFLRGLVLAEGAVTVAWHSIMWQYLSAEGKAAAEQAIAALAALATAAAPFAHLSLEPGRRSPDSPREFLVVLQVWPSGERRVLGTAAPHGIPAVWE